MDTTGSELAHAAIEMDRDITKKPWDPSGNGPATADDHWDEKREKDIGHLSTASEDGQHLKQLDSRIVKVDGTKDGDEAYSHLPPHEREIIKKQLEIPDVKVSFKTLFRYATKIDIIIIVISSICAVAGGAVQPLMTVSCSAPEERGIGQLNRRQDRIWAIDRRVSSIL